MENEPLLQQIMQFLGEFRKTAQREMNRAVGELPRCHFGMLEQLHFIIRDQGKGGAVPVGLINRQFHMAPPAVSRALHNLESQGSIRRFSDPSDRRRTLVEITPQGEKARRRCEAAMHGYLRGIIDRLGEENVRRILADWRLLEQAMKDEAAARAKAREQTGDRKGETTEC